MASKRKIRKSKMLYDIQDISTQPRPHLSPLPYGRYKTIVEVADISLRAADRTAQKNSARVPPDYYDVHARVYNRALVKLDDKLGRSAGFFETWYERQKSIDMIKSAVKEISWILKNYRNPKRIYKKYKRKMSTLNKTPADIPSAWLAYQFGIKPLIFSIDDALHLLNKDFPVEKINATSKESFRDDYTHPADDRLGDYIGVDYLVKLGVTITGVNPNIDLAAQVGFTQPFSSAWAIVPWSWAVDYIVDVSSYLSNFEPRFPGLNLSDDYETRHQVAGQAIHHGRYEKGKLLYGIAIYQHVATQRFVGRIPSYNFVLKMKPLNVQQTSYLTSALALTMKGMSKK